MPNKQKYTIRFTEVIGGYIADYKLTDANKVLAWDIIRTESGNKIFKTKPEIRKRLKEVIEAGREIITFEDIVL